MYKTIKICNLRDCNNGKFEKCPHNAVNVCEVFLDEETNMWYHELTGNHVSMYEMGDGSGFDVQAWLTGQIQKAASNWKPHHKVHEKHVRKEPKLKDSAIKARMPIYSNKQLDLISDKFIRSKVQTCDLDKEIKELGEEMHGYRRMSKKWSVNPILIEKIREIKEKRDALIKIQSEVDKSFNIVKSHIEEENRWTRAWSKKNSRWNNYILTYRDIIGMWAIDRNGLKLNNRYLYLPKLDSRYMESANWANTNFCIPKNKWNKVNINEKGEVIGIPIRRFGKKNANGARISSRMDHKKYAQCVTDLVKTMKQMKIDVNSFATDESLKQLYLNKVAPKFTCV